MSVRLFKQLFSDQDIKQVQIQPMFGKLNVIKRSQKHY
jgi:hypothetical protein